MNYTKRIITTYGFGYQVRFKVPGTQSVIFVKMVRRFVFKV